MRLNGKVCLVTGAATGIGQTTAARFAEEGATVVICDVNAGLGQQVAAGLGPHAAFYPVNVADRQAVQGWVDEVVARFGRIDVLVNNAGITRDGQFVKFKEGQVTGQMSEPDFDLVVAVNLKGVFNCAQAVVPAMIRGGGGVILNASSVVGLYGNFGQTNYVATKAGVIGMTRVWARELGRFNIRVNAVAPGFVLTDMVRQMPDKVLETMRGRTPLGRLGDPRDIADTYLFLASDEARFITGAVIQVDGGLVLGT